MRNEIAAEFGAPIDLSLGDLILVGDEPRILDTRIAVALGFKRPTDIRPLISRHEAALTRFGPIIRMVRKNSGRGRPARESYLNKRQSLFICTKAETARATEVTIQMVDVFDAYLNEHFVTKAPGASALVSYGALAEIVRVAATGVHGPNGSFGRNLLNALDDAIGNPWSGDLQ